MTKWIEHSNGICWEESTLLKDAGLRHGVTGKSGGVSEAPYTSLNLALHVGDNVKDVLENRRRLCATVGCSLAKLTMAEQTHEDHIVAVGPAEAGCGAGSYADALAHTDALMTNLPGVPLMLCIADCVPVIVYDPVKKACAVIHDGWRGTVQRLAAKTIFAMRLAYGSQPQDLLAYVGPSISRAHYEVSEDTAMAFRRLGPQYGACAGEKDGVWSVDLWQANRLLLLEAGLAPQHIDVTESCAFAEDGKFYSYRRDGGHTGRMGAFAVI
ncbi:peptidoglycan editing factor PgeF [uncultured Megasphaera sp.]|uniref:peptidoglycan editing factor PgeF n=1 Tax=uncultured Megasphaera sp. TaxID=165188 RepID=UPI0025E53A81|nr:peptidoglycan editing factor PgeF [uncultured Megasphaera sp.]